jgi:hypothetical protein
LKVKYLLSDASYPLNLAASADILLDAFRSADSFLRIRFGVSTALSSSASAYARIGPPSFPVEFIVRLRPPGRVPRGAVSRARKLRCVFGLGAADIWLIKQGRVGHAHLASEHVDELRQGIDASGAEELT